MRLLIVSLVLLLSASASADERVLVIGDSHATSTFGKALDLLLRTLPDTEVTTIGSCGVTPSAYLEGKASNCGNLQIAKSEPDWIVRASAGNTPKIQTLLDTWDPTLTIVELGANQIHRAYKNPEGAANEARMLAEAIRASGSKCLWVGPPFGRDFAKPTHKMQFLYSVLEHGVSDLCSFTDSRPSALTFLDYERVTKNKRRKGDGRHFDAIGVVGQGMARRWALSVFHDAKKALEAKTKKQTSDERLCKDLAAKPFDEVRRDVLLNAKKKQGRTSFAAR